MKVKTLFRILDTKTQISIYKITCQLKLRTIGDSFDILLITLLLNHIMAARKRDNLSKVY